MKACDLNARKGTLTLLYTCCSMQRARGTSVVARAQHTGRAAFSTKYRPEIPRIYILALANRPHAYIHTYNGMYVCPLPYLSHKLTDIVDSQKE